MEEEEEEELPACLHTLHTLQKAKRREI